MFRWNYREKIKTNASAQQIWAMWKNVELWPSWDKDLEWVKLGGEFEVGAHGSMKPTKGPVVNFKLTDVVENKKFINTASLPLTKMEFIHIYEPAISENEDSYIEHTISMNGLLAPLFGFFIGRQIAHNLGDAMRELSAQASTI